MSLLNRTTKRLLAGSMMVLSIIGIAMSVRKISLRERVEFCKMDPALCLEHHLPEKIRKIVKSEEQFMNGNRLNLKFFRQFRHHLEDRVADPDDISANNKKLYEDHVAKKPIVQPKIGVPNSSDRANATFISLIIDHDVKSVVNTVKEIESSFNKKYNYPWTFISPKPFSKSFMKKVRKHTEYCDFVVIDPAVWQQPMSSEPTKKKEKTEQLTKNRNRFLSGAIFQLPQLEIYRYYWRVEPSSHYYCDIDYDVFKYMELNKKSYGFNINIYGDPNSMKGLWDTTVKFLEKNPHLINSHGSFDWLLQDLEHPEYNTLTNGYSTCHFSPSFEIVDMNFFRGKTYTKYFSFLDRSGGFHEEKWGNGPVHSIGLGLFEDKSKIHWFRDIGYSHQDYLYCPNSYKCQEKCSPGNFTLNPEKQNQNCMANWMKYSMTSQEFDVY